MVKHSPWALALASLAAFVTLAGFTLTDSGAPGSSPDRTVYSFASSIAHHNFGRTCSWYSQKMRGNAAMCAQSLAIYVGQTAAVFGVDIADGMHVVPGSKHLNNDGSYTYKIAAKDGGESPIRVAKQANGKWRVAG